MTPIRIRTIALLVLASAALLLGGCPSSRMARDQSTTLDAYEKLVRFSQWDAATKYLAPEYLEENPLTRLDLDRLDLFQVTSYTPRQVVVQDDGMALQQVVEIRMFNRYQAVEKRIIDQQLWRWHEDTERWLLHSGLPDVTRSY